MDHQKLLHAISFAANKHRNQRRKNAEKTPYINHPIDVAQSLSNANVTDVNTLMAAVLHDTIEDTNTTYSELVSTFGSEVADIVMEVTDDKSLDKSVRKRLQIEHAKIASVPAKLVKLADKLSNTLDLLTNPPVSWTKNEINGYAAWSYMVVKQMKGTNDDLESKLFSVFEEFGITKLGESELEAMVEEYYKEMDQRKNAAVIIIDDLID